MSKAADGKGKSHPVDVECPSCCRRFKVPLSAFSPGTVKTCPSCNSNIQIATDALLQLLQEIDNDLDTTEDLPLVLKSAECRPSTERDCGNGREPAT